MEEHDTSMRRWLKIFNDAFPLYVVAVEKNELYVADGYIKTPLEKISFDWQKRDEGKKPWICGSVFPYSSLGQYERKFKEEMGIECTIQCNRNETHFVFAWHKDFGKPIRVSRQTDYLENESGLIRFTKKFSVFSYAQMPEFKIFFLESLNKQVSLTKFFY